MSAPAQSRAIVVILIGMVLISINDMLIKILSSDYPLHQMVFIRSAIALMASTVFLHLKGGWRLLKTDRPVLHAIRAAFIVAANTTFFAALAVMPLGPATALFFVAPLFITLLAIPVLGERVGRHRIAALLVGFLGVAVMMAPGVDWGGVPRGALILPVIAAFCYASMQVLTRKLGAKSAASAMAIYIQVAFILVSTVFYLVAGDGRFEPLVEHESLKFLLRAWRWPPPEDLRLFLVMGGMAGGIGYLLSLAYRIGEPATVASFEYTALPLAIFWGWLIFGEVPSAAMWLGIALIAGAGLYVFARERARARTLAATRPLRRG